MILRDVDGGKSFGLRIVRYQYPDPTSVKGSDLGWLMTFIRLLDEHGDWRAADPALEYYDIPLLAGWLRQVALGNKAGSFISFLEPCLAFGFEKSSGERRAIKVHLGHELRPPGRPTRRKRIPTWRRDGSKSCYYISLTPIEFTVTPENLVEAADSLMEELRKLPPREGIPKPRYRPEYLARIGVSLENEDAPG